MRHLLTTEPLHRRRIRSRRNLNVQVQAVVFLQDAEREGFELSCLVRGNAPVAAHLQWQRRAFSLLSSSTGKLAYKSNRPFQAFLLLHIFDLYGFSTMLSCVYDSFPIGDLGSFSKQNKDHCDVDVYWVDAFGSQPQFIAFLCVFRQPNWSDVCNETIFLKSKRKAGDCFDKLNSNRGNASSASQLCIGMVILFLDLHL